MIDIHQYSKEVALILHHSLSLRHFRFSLFHIIYPDTCYSLNSYSSLIQFIFKTTCGFYRFNDKFEKRKDEINAYPMIARDRLQRETTMKLNIDMIYFQLSFVWEDSRVYIY
jgi:hypothetical protein